MAEYKFDSKFKVGDLVYPPESKSGEMKTVISISLNVDKNGEQTICYKLNDGSSWYMEQELLNNFGDYVICINNQAYGPYNYDKAFKKFKDECENYLIQIDEQEYLESIFKIDDRWLPSCADESYKIERAYGNGYLFRKKTKGYIRFGWHDNYPYDTFETIVQMLPYTRKETE